MPPTITCPHELPQKLFGYDVVQYLGEGAASHIYAVSDPATAQLYALKHVVRKTEKDERFLEQLEAEFKVGSAVNHPNLRKCLDLKSNRSLLLKINEAALIMELFDGQPMDQLPDRPIHRKVAEFFQVAKGLEALHAAGYVHCDLKPNNILIAEQDRPEGRPHLKVIDLGQGCPVGTTKERIQGTPDYIAPEQVKCDPLTHRTDVFNFGATMYWAFTGQKLPTLFNVKKSGGNSFLLESALKSPQDLNPLVPNTLSNFIMECVRMDPMQRPPNMKEITTRLEVIHYACTRAARAAS